MKACREYATLFRVSFRGIPFTQYHILFTPCRQPPLKKGNSQMDSSVQDNPAAPSPCQYCQFRVVPCPLPLEYQAASSQARLKSCWALPPCSDLSGPLCRRTVWRQEQPGRGARDVRAGGQPLQDGQEVGQGRPHLHQDCREALAGRSQVRVCQLSSLKFINCTFTVLESANAVVEYCVFSMYCTQSNSMFRVLALESYFESLSVSITFRIPSRIFLVPCIYRVCRIE